MQAKPGRKDITHDRIVDTAARAIRRAGYAGVGVADVMKEAGLTHGGFYAHFASRDALLAEAVERAGRDSGAALRGQIEIRAAQGESRFRAIVETYLADHLLRSCESGCPVAALSSEMPRQSPEVRDASARRVAGLMNLVRDALPSGTPDDQAMLVTSALVGAVQLARALGDNAQGRAVLAAARTQLLAQYDAPAH